jgi:hypothetical protein
VCAWLATFAPILISFSLSVSDPPLIGSGAASVSGEAGYDADDGGGDQLGLSPNLCSAATA